MAKDIDLKQIIRGVVPNLIVVIMITALNIVMPNHNIIVFVLIVLTSILVYKLYDEVFKKVKPNKKSWAKTIITTAAVATGLYLLVQWLKGYGILAFAGFILLYAAFKVYIGRKLFIDTSKYIGGIIYDKETEQQKKQTKHIK